MLLRKFSSKILNLESLGAHIKSAEYAVRGDVVIRASQLEKSLKRGEKLNFTELVPCNIGNPQILGQKPLTWIRQVLSLIINPDLLKLSSITSEYPADVLERAKYLLSRISGGAGAYSESQGLEVVRESVANYIGRRDKTQSPDPNNIFLSAGASPAVETVLSCLISSPKVGVMIPIPQYPLYSALIALKQGQPVGYYMEESQDQYWKLSIPQMQAAYDQATEAGFKVNSIVVINPGNPTGQVLSEDNLKRTVEFAEKNRLVILADEVYQDNVYMEDKKFKSFRKTVLELKTNSELFSFHTLSKGYFGECGLRGGYMELMNIDPDVKAQILKMVSIQLCPTVVGQVAMELGINPPTAGMPSFERFDSEKNAILGSLKRKAKIMYEMMNSMQNVQCNYVEGAMYAMPNVKFSARAQRAAKDAGMPVDKFYAMGVLEHTGIIVVPGSGFGQQPGSFHFRITILSPEEKIRETLERFKRFNDEFHQRFKD